MKLKSLIATASLGAALLMAASAANAITYTGTQNIDGETVDISITTDGTLGLIQSTHFTAFDVNVSGPVGTFDMNSDSPFDEIETSFNQIVTATPTALTALVSSNGGLFYTIGEYADDFGFFCVGGICGINGDVVGESIGLYAYGSGGPIDGEASVTDPNGTVITLGTVSAAPEPAAWALMIAGTGIVGGAMRARARRLFAGGTDVSSPA